MLAVYFSRFTRKTSAGFTLIELLIVVAIIAILAAIAVPNFLEAQTRSKVSRAKADIRTIAIALESYRIDALKYPNMKSSVYLLDRLTAVTSPIAYMSTIPIDVFNPGKDWVSIPNPVTNKLQNVYTYGENDSGWYDLSVYADQLGRPSANLKWCVFSYGPVQNALDFPVQPPACFHLDYKGNQARGYTDDVYDPTNGTVSNGIVVQIGP
jgi:type II secretion system protein G